MDAYKQQGEAKAFQGLFQMSVLNGLLALMTYLIDDIMKGMGKTSLHLIQMKL